MEYTAKDVTTGIVFVCLAYERSEINSLRFAHLLFQHLLRHGVDVTQLSPQTDNGTEFIGHVEARRPSAFTRLVEQRCGARHLTIPVRAPRFNGMVENFHGRVEDEFYTLDPLPTEEEVLQEKAPKISPDVAAFPPVVLDRLDLSAVEMLPPVSGGSGENRPDAHISCPPPPLGRRRLPARRLALPGESPARPRPAEPAGRNRSARKSRSTRALFRSGSRAL
ncbi:MAG: hypothetical protein QN149_13000 [Armatimonadota bacterium]|nr:hypothetical protein [Armatimonadota bacterium]